MGPHRIVVCRGDFPLEVMPEGSTTQDALNALPVLLQLGNLIWQSTSVHDACIAAGLHLTSAQVSDVLRVLHDLAHTRAQETGRE